MFIELSKSTRELKKWSVTIHKNHTKRTIHFGAKGYSDYTLHKDKQRMKRYIQRHQSRENWKKSGIYTAGFWARWILWNKPSLYSSIKDTEKRFNVKIKRVY